MPTLYVVATPIGNLGDMTPRAIETLQQVALIAAEDTRVTQKLLNAFDIHTPLTSCHEHNERSKAVQKVGNERIKVLCAHIRGILKREVAKRASLGKVRGYNMRARAETAHI